MVKIIRVNYNYIAAFLGVVVVAAFCLFELVSPARVTAADAQAGNAAVEKIVLPVAMYHHMLPQQDHWGDYVISPNQFEQDLQYIQKCGYTSVSAQDLEDYYDAGTPLPEKPILITFDDGNASFYKYAYPLLEKYNMKAIVSIIGNQTDLYSDGEPQNVIYSHMTWDMLREMRDSGFVEIGNHTYNMHDNTPGHRYGINIKPGESGEQYRQAIYGDVGKQSDKMAQELGERPDVFAYPYGVICEESRPLLKEIGFRIVLTCEERVNRLSPSAGEGMPDGGPLYLKRFNRAHKYSTYQFFKKMGIVAPAAEK